MTASMSQRPRTRFAWESVDPVAVVRGASSAFSVLVIGGLLAPIVAAVSVPAAMLWLPLTAVAAFVVAGVRAASSPWPPLGGAAAALSGYLLVLPLVLLDPAGRNPGQIGATAAIAIVAGAASAWYRTAKASRGGRGDA